MVEQLADHARQAAPRECCGLLTLPPLRYQPVRNVAAGLNRFEMDPGDLLAVLMGLEEQGGSLWGIFHSHPTHPAAPSAADLAEAHYPDAVYLILSLAPAAVPGAGLLLQPAGALRAYRRSGQAWQELSLRVVGS
ncbi:MAG: M67 family metallopeptidase [Symbiobacteriia bacterium]